MKQSAEVCTGMKWTPEQRDTAFQRRQAKRANLSHLEKQLHNYDITVKYNSLMKNLQNIIPTASFEKHFVVFVLVSS